LSITLAVALSAGLLAGCGSGSRNGSKQSEEPAASGTSPSGVKLNKDAKIRIFSPTNANVKGFESGASLNDNQFVNAIREKTGYKNLEWVTYDPSSKDKLSVLFAGGEQMDLLNIQNGAYYNFFDTQDVFQPIDDELAKAGSDLKKLVPDAAWEAVKEKGRTMAVPVPFYQEYNGTPVTAQTIIVRQDLMDKYGLKAPKTTEAFYQLLKTIKAKEPDIIPYVGDAGGADPLKPLTPLIAPFGLSVPYEVQGGKLVPTADLYDKDALAYVTKLYSEGLLDKEYLFNKLAQRNEKITSGKAFAFSSSVYSVSGLRKSLVQNVPSASFSMLPELEGPGGKKGQAIPYPVSQYNVIPKTAKYPLEAMDLLNQLVRDKDLQMFINYGKEGVHYEKKDGMLTPIQPAYNDVIYKIYFRLWNDPDIWLPNALLAGYGDDMKTYVANGPRNTVFDIAAFKPTSDAEVNNSKTQTDLKNEYFAKIITGALPLSALDDYFKKADAAGRQDILKADQAWFDKEGKAIYDKLGK
jgi:putative aldouronate transport system substrate-binding protein